MLRPFENVAEYDVRNKSNIDPTLFEMCFMPNWVYQLQIPVQSKGKTEKETLVRLFILTFFFLICSTSE